MNNNTLTISIILLILISAFTGNKNEIIILVPGTYHADEVIFYEKPQKFIGLYKNEDSTYFKECTVHFERVYDAVLDKEGEKSGIRVFTKFNDEIILLPFIEFQHMINQSVENLFKDTLKIYKDKKFRKKLKNRTKTILYSKGHFLWVKNFEKKEKLSKIYPKNTEVSLTIVFAGDLNGDGYTDLLLNDIFHSNTWINYRLFLTSSARKNPILNEVGRITGQGSLESIIN